MKKVFPKQFIDLNYCRQTRADGSVPSNIQYSSSKRQACVSLLRIMKIGKDMEWSK